jgi:exopolysaccharide biosynthesis polyprenyl glycosylphosphotransferase
MTLVQSSPRRLARTELHLSARLVPAAAVAVDVVLLAAGMVMAMLGRQRLPFFDARDDVSYFVLQAAGPLLVGWLAMLRGVGGYARDVFGAGTEEYKRIIRASVLCAGLVGIGCYLTSFPLSRGFFFLAFAIGTPLVVLGRVTLRRVIHRARVGGHLRETLVIAGDPAHVDEVAAVLRRESWLGYTLLGALTAPGVTATETPSGIPVVGHTDAVAAAVEDLGAEVILFSEGAFGTSKELRRATWGLEGLPVQCIVVPSLTDVSSRRVKVRPVAGLPLVHLESCRSQHASRWAKRIFDVLGALCLLVVLVPVTLATALAVKLHDGGPVLFRQVRVGRDGLPFACLKFRSMVVDAEHLRGDLVPSGLDNTVLFKMADDPRVTRPGRWIRRFSLDELPQLWNVVRGQMSLVGPRPPLPDEVARYEDDMNRRLRVRPGMTGLWQVSGRSDLSWDETVRLDLYYVDNWSMVQDLAILARTFRAVVGSHGAY